MRAGALGLAGVARIRQAAVAAAKAFFKTTVLDLGAGGFCDGLCISDDGTVRLVKTDGSSGTGWWSTVFKRWIPILNAASLNAAVGGNAANVNGGPKALVCAPSLGLRGYMHLNSDIYRSDDGFRSFYPVLLGQTFSNGNDTFRSWHEPMAVDPRNPDVMFDATQTNGLIFTRDGGDTFTFTDPSVIPYGTVVMLGSNPSPDITASTASVNGTRVATDIDRTTLSIGGVPAATGGVTCVAFDRGSPVVPGTNRTSVIYVTVYGVGVYRTSNGGDTWAQISSTLQGVRSLRVLSDRTVVLSNQPNYLLTSDNSDLWTYTGGTSGNWAKSTIPAAGTYRAVTNDGDPNHPGRVAAMALGTNQRLIISNDYGKTFSIQPSSRSCTATGDVTWLETVYGGTSNLSLGLGMLVWDPAVPGRLFLTGGTGMWYWDTPATIDVNTVVAWKCQSAGITQLVANCMLAFRGGKVSVGHYDRAIFSVPDDPFNNYPSGPQLSPGLNSCWGMAESPFDTYAAATIGNQNDGSGGDNSRSGRTTDNGVTWSAFPTVPVAPTGTNLPNFVCGQVAVSSAGNVVWVAPYGVTPQYTTDDGQHWQTITVAGFAAADYAKINVSKYFTLHNSIVADRVNRDWFYLYVSASGSTGGTYKSTDKGANFTKQGGVTGNALDFQLGMTMRAAPDNAGHLWLTQGPDSNYGVTDVNDVGHTFWRSTNGGVGWTAVGTIRGVGGFAFGKAAPGATYPTLFAWGWVGGVFGLWMSTDAAASWVYVTRYPAGKIQQFGPAIAASPDTFGLVYLGSLSGYATAELSWLNLP